MEYIGCANVYKTLGWKDSLVGQAYRYLFPNDIKVTRNGALHTAIVSNFQTGMLTLNFCNNYHLDKRDRDIPTHCSFSPPSSWQSTTHSTPKCVFGMGSVCVDLTHHPVRISFLPHQIIHCTS